MTNDGYDHNTEDPMAYLNAIEAVWLASDATVPRCPHCAEERHMLPMPGNGWAVEIFHEPRCPNHEDNQLPVGIDFTDRPDA